MKDKTGRPLSPNLGDSNYHDLEGRSFVLYRLVKESDLTVALGNKINWMDGGIDGGGIGITGAMPGFADEPANFDGGVI